MNNKNLVKQTVSSWQLDESVLSDADKMVLDIVGFPKVLKSGAVLIRRTKKRNYAKVGWIDKENIEMGDIRYLTTSYKVALYTSNSEGVRSKDGKGVPFSGAELKAQAEKLEEIQSSRSFRNTFIDADNIDGELTAILDAFSQPALTPSMKKETTSKAESIEFTELEKVEEKPKKLSNIDKGVAKRMYSEESKSLEEIVAVMGEEKKERILTYIKTL